MTGHPRYDTMRLDVVDDQTVMITEKKNGRKVQTLRTVISPGGNTAYWEYGSNLASDHRIASNSEQMRKMRWPLLRVERPRPMSRKCNGYIEIARSGHCS